MTEKMNALAEFRAKFRTEELKIADFGTWRLSLRPEQLTLGAMILSLKSGDMNLSDLKAEQGCDMAAAFSWAENASRQKFGAVRLNLLCLMMKDPIVHFHILPRYAHRVDCAGQSWVDTDWPGPPLVRPIETDELALQTILAELRSLRRPQNG